MDHKTVEQYILSMPDSRLDYPFGEDVAVYKVSIEDEKYDDHQGESQEKPHITQQSAASSEPGLASSQDGANRGEWKMYALIQEGKDPVRLSLKCDPELGKVLRERYESVQEGYHLNKKHWITIILSGQLSWPEVQDLIRHSYQLVSGQQL